jgi:hypothetical protein
VGLTFRVVGNAELFCLPTGRGGGRQAHKRATCA